MLLNFIKIAISFFFFHLFMFFVFTIISLYIVYIIEKYKEKFFVDISRGFKKTFLVSKVFIVNAEPRVYLGILFTFFAVNLD